MHKHFLLLCFIATALSACSRNDGFTLEQCALCPHQMSAEKIAHLFDQTFGKIATLDQEVSKNLREVLLHPEQSSIDNQMLFITRGGSGLPALLNMYEGANFPKPHIETEKNYRNTATKFIQKVYEEKFENLSYDKLCAPGKSALIMAAKEAYVRGFDQIVYFFIEKGVIGYPFSDAQRLGIPIQFCINQQKDPYYAQRRIFYISTIKYWLKKFMAISPNYFKEYYLISLNDHLELAQRNHEPEICSLLVQHGADHNKIGVGTSYLLTIGFNWVILNSEIAKGKYEGANKHLLESPENRKMRTWDVLATAEFFPAFEALWKDKESYASQLPKELIDEIRKYRFGISKD